MTDGPGWTYTDMEGDQMQVGSLESSGDGPVVTVSVSAGAVYVRPQDIPAVARALYQAAGFQWFGEDATGLLTSRVACLESLVPSRASYDVVSQMAEQIAELQCRVDGLENRS